LQQLRHERDDKRLRDRLAMADRERSVFVSFGPVLEGHELVSRHLGHCGTHAWTEPSHIAGARGRGEHCVDLLDHSLAIGDVLLRRASRNQHGTSQDRE
jgi:hypothetical protein